MEKRDWEERLAQRHQSPPPPPAGEWQAVVERNQARSSRAGWTMAWGGGLAMAALALFFLVPSQAPVKAAAEDEDLATEQWVQQQWGSTTAGALADDQADEPDAGLLKLIDKV